MPHRNIGKEMKKRAFWSGAAIVAIGVGLRFGPALADEPARSYPPGTTPAYTSTVSYDWSGIYFGGQLGRRQCPKRMDQ